MAFVKYLIIQTICVTAFVVAVYAADGEVKQCVNCANHDTCNDKVDIDNVPGRCNLTEGMLCERFSFKDSSGTVTSRDCVTNTTTCDSQRIRYKDSIKDNSTWTCYMCNTDLCNKENSAGSIGVSVVSMVATVLTSLYMK